MFLNNNANKYEKNRRNRKGGGGGSKSSIGKNKFTKFGKKISIIRKEVFRGRKRLERGIV